MESVTRWIFIALAAVLAWIYIPKILGGGSDSRQPIGVGRTETAQFAVNGEPEKCAIQGKRFKAELSTRGAALVDHYITGDPRYTEGGKPIEVTTVPALAPNRFNLLFDWRSFGANGDKAQVPYDVADWKLAAHDETSCTFTYVDEQVRLTKTVRAGNAPYELLASATIENLSDAPRIHRLGVENTAWRTHQETDSHLGRQSPFTTEVLCAYDGGKLERKSLSDFGAKDFEKPEFEGGWFLKKGAVDFVATSNAYFAQAIAPVAGPAAPACGLQVEERWHREQYPDKTKDPLYGAMYRSRLVYPAKELAPHEAATYEVAAYYGPKDRDILAAALGGHHLSELINLGTFAVVSKVLVSFLIKSYEIVGNWGISIIVLTICVRVLLFPLTWKQIKSMVSMRRLKPEIDEINRKFKDDAQQKQVATMEMYRKNGVNPFSGCLPVFVQLPVWWALYSVLATAVELYHTPFLWFRDLSAPDPYFVMPIVLGATSFVQQKLMPPQADPAQQKMMLYFMPALFTFMMLFLPSGLGIYMLTNSILGIVQQQAVERFAPSARAIQVSDAGDKGQPGKKGQQSKLSGTLPAKLKGGS